MRRKIMAMAAALVMLAALAPDLTAYASGAMEITVHFTVEATEENPRTFRAYKIFDVDEDAGGGYSYSLNPAFGGFRHDVDFFIDNSSGYPWHTGQADLAVTPIPPLYEYLYTLQDGSGNPLPAAEAAMKTLIDRLMFYIRYQPGLEIYSHPVTGDPAYDVIVSDTPLAPDGAETVTGGFQATIAGLSPGYYLITGQSGDSPEPTGDAVVGVFAVMTFGTSPGGKTEIRIYEKADGKVPEISKRWTYDERSSPYSSYIGGTGYWDPNGNYHLGKQIIFYIEIDLSAWDFVDTGHSYFWAVSGFNDDYVFTVRDAMSEGLTYMPETIMAQTVNSGRGFSDRYSNASFFDYELNPVVDGERINGFSMTMKPEFLYLLAETASQPLSTSRPVILQVSYSAYLNENAVSVDHESGNPGGTNVAFLDYGNDPHDAAKFGTVSAPPVTIGVYDMSVFKYYGNKTGLAGAEFELIWPLVDNYNWFVRVQDGDGDIPSVYRPALPGETPDTIISPESGLILIRGLGPIYDLARLRETSPPQHYTELTGTVDFWFEPNDGAMYSYFQGVEGGSHVEIENRRVSPFPETGGPGTGWLPLYIAGVSLITIIGTAVLIRRRYVKTAETRLGSP